MYVGSSVAVMYAYVNSGKVKVIACYACFQWPGLTEIIEHVTVDHSSHQSTSLHPNRDMGCVSIKN